MLRGRPRWLQVALTYVSGLPGAGPRPMEGEGNSLVHSFSFLVILDHFVKSKMVTLMQIQK